MWQDEQGRWNKYGGRLPWPTSAICNNNTVFGGTGNHKTGEDYTAAPNIDHTQDFVRQDIIKWLKLLRSIGFDGFRFDFVKGYSASRPTFLTSHVARTLALFAAAAVCSAWCPVMHQQIGTPASIHITLLAYRVPAVSHWHHHARL